MKHILKRFWLIIKKFVFIVGCVALIMLGVSFTSLPYWGYRFLGSDTDTSRYEPDCIVLLGSNGMPDGDGLLKCFYTARAALAFPKAAIVLALPSDSEPQKSSDISIMVNELFLHGIDTNRILFENKGINTYHQALNIKTMLTNRMDSCKLMIITNPEHLYRSLATFRALGYQRVGGLPAYSRPLDEEVLIQKRGAKNIEPANLALRYNFWNYLKLEISILREYTAIAYYKCRGWL